MSWLRNSVLLGSLAGTACANIYGVGELTLGAEDNGGAATAGSSGSQPAPSAGGSKTQGSGAGSTLTIGNGGSTLTIGNGGSTFTIGNGGSAGVSGNDRTISSAGVSGSGGSPARPPPSCAELPAICGTSEAVSKDCCASLEVTGGSFFRSYDGLPAAGWDDPAWPAKISTFRLDVYEVSVGRFRRFLASYPWRAPSGAGRNPANSSDFGWNAAWNTQLPRDAGSLSLELSTCGSNIRPEPSPSTWTADPGANEALPINCLTWFEAFAFCAWDGGRLPSEAEWNYAAAGGAQARIYPWASPASTDVDPNHAVYQSSIAKVGSKPLGNGLFGQADLAGNVWEWNVDWYWETYRVPCDDCAELTAAADSPERVMRGGSYYNQPPFLRAAMRAAAPPSTRDYGVGVRCARE